MRACLVCRASLSPATTREVSPAGANGACFAARVQTKGFSLGQAGRGGQTCAFNAEQIQPELEGCGPASQESLRRVPLTKCRGTGARTRTGAPAGGRLLGSFSARARPDKALLAQRGRGAAGEA